MQNGTIFGPPCILPLELQSSTESLNSYAKSAHLANMHFRFMSNFTLESRSPQMSLNLRSRSSKVSEGYLTVIPSYSDHVVIVCAVFMPRLDGHNDREYSFTQGQTVCRYMKITIRYSCCMQVFNFISATWSTPITRHQIRYNEN